MAEFDQLAEHYDLTRGGEPRGDQYASEIERILPADEGVVLEIGVGTGVVALGLARRQRRVVGVDVSGSMLEFARNRLGPVVVRGDATRLPFASGSVSHAVAVWVVHAVGDPVALFAETARVLAPGGLLVVCAGQRPAPDDRIGQIMADMAVRIDIRRNAARPRAVTTEQVVSWAGEAGFVGDVHQLERTWTGSPADELEAVRLRSWPALRELDDQTIDDVTQPTIMALRALPETKVERRAIVEMIAFRGTQR